MKEQIFEKVVETDKETDLLQAILIIAVMFLWAGFAIGHIPDKDDKLWVIFGFTLIGIVGYILSYYDSRKVYWRKIK
ncbi:hypothetical protein LCGC14_0465800 [marine sediment metagenome]|uniref:Uncharacterized protein n=1 Tax=marine sediment metagenome TaxID=412755 RepID=A0A0F9V0I6_9ZZZZ